MPLETIDVKTTIEIMQLTFLGTRGEIKIRSRRHQRHSFLCLFSAVRTTL